MFEPPFGASGIVSGVENTVGGRDDEQSLAVMGGTDVGSSNARPSDMQPVLGHVSENSIEPQRPVAGHILQDRKSGS